jgi:predicted nucleic acid-binding protein
MAKNVVVDSGFLVALLSRRDLHHEWAVAQARQHAGPWRTCEAVLSETFHLIGIQGLSALNELLHRQRLVAEFAFDDNLEPVLALMQKYKTVPMSFADACVVRMTEVFSDPVVLTTDSEFRVYRRHSRQVVPSVLP